MNNRVILAGLPATGKTSYLALLYHAIVEERAGGLRLGRFDDDREHITEISDVLLASNVAVHTAIDDEQNVTLSLHYHGADFVLDIPDLSGETWEHALVDRRWSSALGGDIAEAAGFMLFVHCKDINDGLTIVDAEQAALALLGGDNARNTRGVDERSPASEVDVTQGTKVVEDAVRDSDGGDPNVGEDEQDEEKHCTQLTQVSLIELLQFFSAISQRPIRVSLVISAWDLEPPALAPQQWLSKNAPMLAQFIEVNNDEVEATVWGVSAQGADFSDEKVREEYRAKDPIDRARVLAADGTKVGIAAPLLWAIRLDP